MASIGQNMSVPAKMPRDAEMGEMLGSAAKEAQEQLHFHRSQLMMWERVAAAAGAGLDQLQRDETSEAMTAQDPSPMEGQTFPKGRY